ncbi:MAG: type II toxin-antitoxin system VapC family toxin [Armatimonadota bacterium]|nr:type II toxin-antitoxin system VapC family toxin [Armatimonadota bacterium]
MWSSTPHTHLYYKRCLIELGGGSILAVCSAVTLADCRVAPLRLNDRDTYREFVDVILNAVILNARNTIFVPIDAEVAQRAAELRVQYNLTLTDAFQVAAALSANCDVFLTNDRDLKRMNEITVLVLSDFVSDAQ